MWGAKSDVRIVGRYIKCLSNAAVNQMLELWGAKSVVRSVEELNYIFELCEGGDNIRC